MTEPFSRTFRIGWEHLDANAHMKNTAYLDLAVNVRMMYFQEQGIRMREFEQRRIGPVAMRDEIEYFREFRLLDSIRVTLTLVGLSADATRFRVRSEFFRQDEKLAARISTTGGWLDLAARKLVVPPEPIAHALRQLTATDDFVELDSSVH